jgi:hypothetical protein
MFQKLQMEANARKAAGWDRLQWKTLEPPGATKRGRVRILQASLAALDQQMAGGWAGGRAGGRAPLVCGALQWAAAQLLQRPGGGWGSSGSGAAAGERSAAVPGPRRSGACLAPHSA